MDQKGIFSKERDLTVIVLNETLLALSGWRFERLLKLGFGLGWYRSLRHRGRLNG